MSWHYTVDDKEAVQSFEHTWKCWAAGKAKGNTEGITVKVGMNTDKVQQKLRAIAKHLEALDDELEEIDKD